MLLSLMIVNHAGSLLFHRDFSDKMPSLTANERLRQAGFFHGMSAFAQTISPYTDKGGIVELQADGFRLERFQTRTGMQFIVLCDVRHPPLSGFLHKVHQLYADYVLKNPFHTMDMPIRCSKFELHLEQAVSIANKMTV
eukprot:m.362119 g.362119  ORF g.362119 m.362119 type:complete len:139 (+) comp20148_c0_seq1:42-458(+)